MKRLVVAVLVISALTVSTAAAKPKGEHPNHPGQPAAVVTQDPVTALTAQGIHAYSIMVWVEAARVEAERVEAIRVEEARLAAEEAERVAAAARVVAPPRQAAVAPTTNYGSSASPCGGDLPPCYVAMRESGGSYSAFNPGGCNGTGCYGKWQFGGFWAGKLGLPLDIWNATPEQQDNAARILWNGGAGCSNWAAC